MDSLNSEYREVLQNSRIKEAAKHDAANTGPHSIPEGVNFKLVAYSDGIPFIKASCSRCKMIVTTGSLKFEFKHCARVDQVPQDLINRLEARQIKVGVRKKPTIVQRITGETPSLVKAF